jgi:ribonuclease J
MEVTDYEPRDVCILSTGSQGGYATALSAAARGKSRLLKLGSSDTVIMSTKAIPGNEESVAALESAIVDSGATLVNNEASLLHASGHAHSGELRAMIRAANPDFLVPVHGEPKHLVEHSKQAVVSPSVSPVLARDGDVLLLDKDGLSRGPSIPAPYVYVDGSVVGLPPSVLNDRLTLGRAGVLAISITLKEKSGNVVAVSVDDRGWRGLPGEGSSSKAIEALVRLAVDSSGARGGLDRDKIVGAIRKRVTAGLPRDSRPLVVVSCHLS